MQLLQNRKFLDIRRKNGKMVGVNGFDSYHFPVKRSWRARLDSVPVWERAGPIYEGNAQPRDPLGHYQKREPFPQSRWSKNDRDHMKDHR